MNSLGNRHLVIFDGVCNFCNGAVNFIIARDPDGHFAFAPMQSDYASEIMKSYGITTVGLDTFVLVKEGQLYMRTDAALEISRDLSGCWYLFNVFKVVPRVVRDWFYRLLARNRYALFGRADTCMLPTAELQSRFIGV